MCISVHDGKFAPPSSIDPSLPRGLDAWFQKALSLDPNARFQSANEMANAYLTELDKAGLLPHWAAARDAKSYSSDPGGLLGGPIIVQKTRRVGGRAILLAVLAMAACLIAATPKETVVAFAGWTLVPVHDMPHLLPTPAEPPPVFEEAPLPWVVPSREASAVRDVARPPFAPRDDARGNPYDGSTAPAGSPDKAAPRTAAPASAQFGI
jgi:hypothetical protein